MSLIHRYQNNGYNIVLDINSGCIHVVDEVTYEVLPYMEEGLDTAAIVGKLGDQFSEEDIKTSVAECEKLKADGMLFTRDVYENAIDTFTKNRQTVVKALCLHIAHDCNLACRYCFAEEGEYHGRRALMSFEVGKKALDFLIANSGSRHNLEVDFFGGEPLMNWQVVKDLVAYGREQEKILRRNGAQGGEPRPDGEGQAPGAVRAVHRPGPRRLGGLKNRAIAGHDGQITVLPGPDQAGQSVQPVAEQGLSLQWTQQLVAPEAAAAARRQIDDVLIHPGPAGPSPG